VGATPDQQLSPEEIEAQIEATREDLADTVAAIGGKVDAAKEAAKPSNLIKTRPVQIGLGASSAAVAIVVLRRRRKRRRLLG
jgi:hypothetical protein